jgi:hypothetical protein
VRQGAIVLTMPPVAGPFGAVLDDEAKRAYVDVASRQRSLTG